MHTIWLRSGTIAYSFTEADAGRHTWDGVMLQTTGAQTLSVHDSVRSTTIPLTVRPTQLVISVSPTEISAGESVTVTVEAQDEQGALIPGYRGGVLFSSTSAFSGLPYNQGLGTISYSFSEADGGSHTWTGVALHTGGEHTITVGDGFRQATSLPILVNEVTLQAVWNTTSAYVDDRTLTLTIRAVDTNGQLVSAYRGALDLQASAETVGLPQSTFNATPDYTFSASDSGEIFFATIAFRAIGDQTVTVTDRGNPTRQITAAVVHITNPPEPTIRSAGAAAPAYPVPPALTLPPPITMQWGVPYVITKTLVGSNSWQGYPEEEADVDPIPASPGTFYLVSGMLQRSPGAWWASTFYVCPYLAWEDTLTTARLSGGGIDGGPGVNDTTALGFGLRACSGGSTYVNNGAPITFGPVLTEEEYGAPFGTQGTHLDIHAAGNSSGGFTFSAGSPSDSMCEPVDAADPVDTRSGLFHLQETDIGVATGCSEIGLNFVRTYSLSHPQGGALGAGWMHNFELRLIPSGNRVILQGPRGTTMIFVDVGGDVYAGVAGAEQTLVKRPAGGWALIHRNQRADLFDPAGRLIAQQDPNGNVLSMTYETYDWLALHGERLTGTRLARVDAPGGRYLWFGYDYYHPDRITIVGDVSVQGLR